MPAFTKGKWKFGDTNGILGIPIFAEGCAFRVAKLEGYVPKKENEANARLIAAAPDMYEALKECYDFIVNIIGHDCEYCSRSLDADGLCIALDDLFARIDGKEE